jgi:Kef-type K+ transport system membrane component KefB
VLSSILHPSPPHPTGAVITAFLLLDLFVVVVLARFLGNVANRFGQPRAVGEIVAGILLGPTLIGADLSLFLVPLEVRPVLSGIASVALVLFMFLVGVEFDRSILRGREGEAVTLGLLSVAVPAAAGFPIGVWMHHSRYAGPAGASLLAFVLFVGRACR